MEHRLLRLVPAAATTFSAFSEAGIGALQLRCWHRTCTTTAAETTAVAPALSRALPVLEWQHPRKAGPLGAAGPLGVQPTHQWLQSSGGGSSPAGPLAVAAASQALAAALCSAPAAVSSLLQECPVLPTGGRSSPWLDRTRAASTTRTRFGGSLFQRGQPQCLGPLRSQPQLCNSTSSCQIAPLSPRNLSTSTALCDGGSQRPPGPGSAAGQERTPSRRQDAERPDPEAQPDASAAASTQATADPIYNLPNAVSAARLVSGPIIGLWLLQGHYEAATVALIISGASDWLDGYLARRLGASSVFGSYLDPLADKVLIGCVAAALLANGDMPVWLAAVVVGRDVLLVSGAFAFRFHGFGWRWPGREAFFRTADLPAATAGGSAATAGGVGVGEAGGGGGGVSYMRPLLISKANTVLQLVLLGGYLMRGMYGWPDGDPVAALEVATAATTVASLAAYATKAVQGRLFK